VAEISAESTVHVDLSTICVIQSKYAIVPFRNTDQMLYLEYRQIIVALS